MIPEGGVATLDGTSITDAALERKLAAAVKRDPSTKVRITDANPQRAAEVRALVTRAGVTNIE